MSNEIPKYIFPYDEQQWREMSQEEKQRYLNPNWVNANPLYVLGFCFNETRSQVALILKDKPDWQKGFYNGIGGKIEAEGSKDAMIREFKEETGLIVKEWRLYAEMLGPHKHDPNPWIVYVFWSIIPDTDFYKITTTEKEKVTKWPITSLPNIKKQPNLSWLIPLALDKINNNVDYEVLVFV